MAASYRTTPLYASRRLRSKPRLRYSGGVKHDPGIFDTRDAEAEDSAIARARADAAAGRGHNHSVVSEWLKTWGTPDRKPFREWLAARDD